MDIRPIRTNDDHVSALREIERLWGAPVGSPESDRLDVLATLVDAYEAERWPVAEVDPVEMLRYAIEEMGHSQSDLAKILGSNPRASEVLNRRRALTVEMIDRISRAWGIPREVLARPYALARSQRTKAAARKRGSLTLRKTTGRLA
jgi:HTH-type transcriptional regulator / antitoxin HigA